MNKLQKLFSHKRNDLLSLFFTAGYPHLEDTGSIILESQKQGIDFLEVGMPYSDPLADGPVIQQSSTVAIANGMTIEKLFAQLQSIKGEVEIPMVLMGYLNPVLQYGTEKFLENAASCGVSGLILPDLPVKEYVEEYKPLLKKYNMSFIFLITPQTNPERIRMIDDNSDAFIYVVSSAATTGKQSAFGEAQQSYFQRISEMGLQNRLIAGFGIHNEQTLQQAWKSLDGAICGSAFLKKLAVHKNASEAIQFLRHDLGVM
ncbi:MAG: tryptophan synthase subunit alpha [Bacteroidota bacterium]